MNKFMRITILAASIAAFVPMTASAAPRAYSASKNYFIAGGGLGIVSVDDTELGQMSSDGPTWFALHGNIGYGMHLFPASPQLAIEPEARLTLGLGEDEDLKLSYLLGFGLKARYHINQNLDAYAGWTWNRLSVKPDEGKSMSSSTLGYVIGGTYFINQNFGIDARIDTYNKLVLFTGGVAITGGVTFKF